MSIGGFARQKTIGLLGTGLATFMQNQLWQGAMKAAQENATRLVYYPTINLGSIPPFDPQSKVLFDLIDARYVDGLLVWYAGIAEGAGIDRGASIFERYKNLPIVTVGGRFKEYPDLSIDNYRGVYSTVEHLITVHHCRNIAIVRGPVGHPDADERYRGYVDVLSAYDLPIHPEYEAHSLFELATAREMTDALVAEWLQKPSLKIDAIVAASDYMALGVIKALEARGLRVPEDIAVVGFDGVDDSQANIPAVTTVYQSFYELGRQGTEMLLALINGQSLPVQSTMPAPLVVRESCGCLARSISLSNTVLRGDVEPGLSPLPIPEMGSPADLVTVAQDLNIPLEQLENLARLFQSDLKTTNTPQFLSALRQSLVQAQKTHFNAIAWQNAISVLRQQELLTSNGGIGWQGETLFNQARVLITEVHQRVYIREKIEIEQQIEKIMRTSETLITSFGEQLFIDTLYKRLPELGFPSFYLLLYEDPTQPALWSRVLIANDNGQRIELPPGEQRVPTGQLIPKLVHSIHPIAPLVVEPLYFQGEPLGLLVLEVGPMEGLIYENLRAQISSALQGSRLTEQVLTRTHQLEAANSELESFSYSISHDLRAPLRAIDSFSGLLIDEYAADLSEEAHHFLNRIQHNTRRMGDLINDLLDFSRIGRKTLQVEDVDMDQLVHEILGDLRADHAVTQAEIIVEPLPPCKADRSLIKQVWINLILNAIKYSSKREKPRIEIGHVARPHSSAYMIKDNGVGFDMRYADKLFGVFQRLHKDEEYEGTGIGLAMVRRIIGRHGGSVWVEAELEKGATFYFSL
ncbi:MAG: substrate-binding domain-containing protein [Anaerolineaceae bacterium]|nr:substrate-binding domain-containing protein [Anaerolineaceae bacterium]